jgi:hypothetical protein
MPDGHVMDVVEVVRFYKGHQLLGQYLVGLMERDPPWIARRQAHGVRLYCPHGQLDPNGHREHQQSVPHTPPNDGKAVRKVRAFVGRCPTGT